MSQHRARTARPHGARWTAAAATATAAIALALSQVGPTVADPLSPAPTSGTATGSYRTGLTAAGLVQLTSLSPAHVYLGIAPSAGPTSAKLDVKVELLDNGTPLGSGLLRCITPLTTSPTDVTVPWSALTPTSLHPGDVLALRSSVRLGTRTDDSKCASNGSFPGVRAFYDSTGAPTRVALTVTASPTATLYAHSDGTPCGTATSSGVSASTLSETPPNGASAKCQGSGPLDFKSGNAWSTVGTWNLAAQCACANDFIPEVRNNPPAPSAEPVSVSELPLPPTAPSTSAGACDASVNPNSTGCLDASDQGLAEGPAYTWDGHGVVLPVRYAGAPASGPGSTYTGDQVIVVKADGTTFSNGDAWKCITCGIPAPNKLGTASALDHPQPFHDGKRILIGTNILDCGPYLITDDACTPDVTHIYPLYWQTSASGASGTPNMRELRLNPDDTHIGWNKINLFAQQGVTEWAYLGRLQWDPSPSTGPAVPRYDLTNVTVLVHNDPNKVGPALSIDPAHPGTLNFDAPQYFIGEFRGFTSDGRSALGGGTLESYNFDVFATSLQTGTSTRLTRNPAYTDPITMSPDDSWSVAMDGRVDDRLTFLAGMPGLPPLKEQSTAAAVAAFYNNGNRRFFEPYLIDRYGDRGTYQGQQLNACGPTDDPTPGSGSICDPLWNGRANPAWSPDGTNVVYWQALVTSPACGPTNPTLPTCPASTEPGGRRTRLMIAHLTGRSPLTATQPAPISDTVPWGVAYHPGDADPTLPVIPAGTYALTGKAFGSAAVTVTVDTTHNVDSSVAVTYSNYSDDGLNVYNGTESGSQQLPASPFGTTTYTFHENLSLAGCHTGSEITSEPAGWVIKSSLISGSSRTGTLTTTLDGKTFTSPANGT